MGKLASRDCEPERQSRGVFGCLGGRRPFLELRAEVSVHLFRQFAAAWLLELMISV